MFSVIDKERSFMKEHSEGYMLLDKKRLDDVARDIMLHQNDAGIPPYIPLRQEETGQ